VPVLFAERSDIPCTELSASARADRSRCAAVAFRSDIIAPGPTPRISAVSPPLAGLDALKDGSAPAASGRDLRSSASAARAAAARKRAAAPSLPLGGRSDPVTTTYPFS
jgi:hypothetical protein